MDIKSLLPTDYNRNRRSEVLALVAKWERSGLLEGLTDDRQEKSNMAVLLESQARQLVTEANRTGTNAGSEEWSGVALPLVRRIFTQIAAKDFVSIQPMNLPTGLVFWLDFKYGTGQAGYTTGAGKDSQADSVFGITDGRRGGTPGTGGLYGTGRYVYSSNDVSASATFASASANFLADLNYDSVVSASLAGSSLIKLNVATSSLTNIDFEAVRSSRPKSTAINSVYPQFTKVVGSTIQYIVSASANSIPAGTFMVQYIKQPTSTSRGDFEAGAASATFDTPLDIPEVNMELRSESITAKTKKLKTKWTDEFAQDLNAFHSLDAEAELTSMLGEYASHEIDLEILDMLQKNAQTTDYWSARNNVVWNGNGFSALGSGFYNSQGEWFQTLGTKIQKVSNTIHTLTLRGGANFMVVSPTVSTVLEAIPGYSTSGDVDTRTYGMGVKRVGSFANTYEVYKNPYMSENMILLGYRGSAFLDTGAVYAPYIPLMMTPVVLDPDNFSPRKGVSTRYGKKLIRPEFYGKIYVEGLQTI